MPDADLTCPRCGSRYKAGAFGGGCPRCLMAAAPTGSGFARFEVLPADEFNAVLQDYDVAELVGTGGMGAVYRARQEDLDREVALKLLSPEAGGDPEFAERFAREARVLGKLAHPNIVPVYGIGLSDDGLPYYSMKLVKGRTLQEILVNLRTGDADTLRSHPLAALLTIFRKVCDALAFAHSQHIIHRDLKPENVMVGEFGEVLVMDWGLAKMTKSEDQNPKEEAPLPPSDFGLRASSFTLTGAVLGTPHYMSPEQARGETDGLDARSDIFSLGGILYAILTLRPPVEGSTVAEVLEKARSGSVVAPSQHSSVVSGGSRRSNAPAPAAPVVSALPHLPNNRVPPALSAVVMKAMARERADRYQTVAELSADIEAWQGGFATRAENAGAWTQMKLLMRRHRLVTSLLALMLVGSAGFVVKLFASEHRATENAALAQKNEQQALAEKEGTRRAFAQAQIALADAAALHFDAAGLRTALEACPSDLRDSTWHYLAAKADASVASLNISTFRGVFRRTGQGPAGGEFLLPHVRDPVIYAVAPDTGKVLREIRTAVQGRKLVALRFDGGELIVSAEERQEYEILACDTGASLLHRSLDGPGFIESPFITADGSRLIMLIPENKTRRLLTAIDRKTGGTLWVHPRGAYLCGYSRDGQWVAAMSPNDGKPVTVLRTDTGEVVSTMEPGHSFLWDLRFSEDGERIVGADFEGYATVWDRASGRRLQSFRVCGGRLFAAAFTANATLVTRGVESAGLGSSRRLQVWSPGRVVMLDAMLGPEKAGGAGFALDPDGGWLCTDGEVTQFWRVPVQRHRRQISCDVPATSAAFVGNHTLLTQHSYGGMQMRRLGPVHDEAVLLPVNLEAGGFFSLGGDGSRVLTADGNRNRVRIVSLTPENQLAFTRPPWDIASGVVALDKTGTHALAGNQGDKVLLYGPGRVEPVREMKLPGVSAWVLLAFADDDRKLLAVSSILQNDGHSASIVACWDRDTGTLLHRSQAPAGILTLAVSPDGRRFAVAGTDKSIAIHSARDFSLERRFRAHDAAINALAWHPSLSLLASVSDDISLKLWNPDTGTPLAKALGISRSILSVAFNSDGQILAAGTADPAVLIFDTVTVPGVRPSP